MKDQIKCNSDRSTAIMAILKIYLGFSVVDFLFSIYQYRVWSNYNFDPVLNSFDGEYDYPEVIQYDLLYGVFSLIFLVIMIISYVRFIMWFRRAYCNLNRVGIATDKKEGWAAGAWFIPIYSLFAPFQIMKEIWNKTQTFYKENAEESNDLALWWGLWVASSLITNQSAGFFDGNGPEKEATINIIASALWIPTTYVTMNLIQKVSFFEKEMYDKAVSDQEAIYSEPEG